MPKLPESNELLRSMYAIACRDGAQTNWHAVRKALRAELFEEAGLADLNDTQTVLRVTCTARTFRYMDDQAQLADLYKLDPRTQPVVPPQT